MTDDSRNSNQRVTNAKLGMKLDYVIETVDEIKEAIALNTEHRITCSERWKQHDREHASLNTKKWAGDIAAAAAGVVAAIGASMAKS
jgi:hypothetical protein